MGKAEIKEVLYRYNAQNCFSREGEDGESVVAWISDTSIDVMGMRFLSSARKDDPNALVTIDEAVHNLFIESLHAIQEPHCKLYVHCLDKPRYVVSAKQPEQKRRDDAKRKAEAKKPSLPMSYRMHSLTREEAGIAVGKDGFSASVYDWKKSVHERATKKHVIAQLCLRAKTLLPQWMAAASIPEDRYIVIDFDDIHTSHSVIVASSRGDLSSDKQVCSSITGFSYSFHS